MDDRQQGREAGGMRAVGLIGVLAALFVLWVFMYVKSSMQVEDPEENSASARPRLARGVTSAVLSAKRQDEVNAVRSQRSSRSRAAQTVSEAEAKKLRWTIDDDVGSMGRFTFVVSMFSDLSPLGMLALPSGLAMTGFVPGFTMLVVSYGLCVYSMYIIARASEITGARDFTGQWMCTFGPGSAWIPATTVVVVCFGNCLAYSCRFADILTQLMPAFGMAMPRSLCLFAFTLFPLLPLCVLKNMAALSKTSTFALIAVIFTAFVMAWRALDGSYAAGGMYFADVPKTVAPDVTTNHLFGFGMKSLSTVHSLSIAFPAHYNGCKYYRELERTTPKKLVKGTAIAMGMSVLLYMVTMTASFQTFGMTSHTVIFENYSRHDSLVNMAQFGMGLAIIASYPLVFCGLREAAIALIKQGSQNSSDWDIILRQDMLSMCLLALITCLALAISDTGVVVGLVGAICDSTIIYILPCILYAASIETFMSENNSAEIAGLRLLTAVAVVLAVGGCYSTLFL